MISANIFDHLPDDLSNETLVTLLQATGLKIERIVSKGHTSPAVGWYDQTQHEWVMVVNGAAMIVFERGERVALTAGSYLDIPAYSKHKVIWTDPNVETIWMAVHYAGGE